jgi:hypothetical protein
MRALKEAGRATSLSVNAQDILKELSKIKDPKAYHQVKNEVEKVISCHVQSAEGIVQGERGAQERTFEKPGEDFRQITHIPDQGVA